MKENLELEKHEVIKEFHFSINKPYTKKVIGEGPYRTGYSYTLLPSFIGLSEAQARSLAASYGLSVSFTGGDGYVIAQSQPDHKRLDLMSKSITLTLGGKTKEEKEKEAREKEEQEQEEEEKQEPTDPVDPVVPEPTPQENEQPEQ